MEPLTVFILGGLWLLCKHLCATAEARERVRQFDRDMDAGRPTRRN